MVKIKKLDVCKGNPFSLAELRLIKEKRDGVIPCYTTDDIIAYAIDIRDWLEKNSRKVVNLTKEEIAKQKSKRNKHFYLCVQRARLVKQGILKSKKG